MNQTVTSLLLYNVVLETIYDHETNAYESDVFWLKKSYESIQKVWLKWNNKRNNKTYIFLKTDETCKCLMKWYYTEVTPLNSPYNIKTFSDLVFFRNATNC